MVVGFCRGCCKSDENQVISIGELVCYLHAYNILLINVAGALVRGVSIIYATTVGKAEATASVMMAPDADQVKISICPGVSKMIFLNSIGERGTTKVCDSLTRLCLPVSQESRAPAQTWS